MRAVMRALKEAGALPHCIVTGYWAMYFYKAIFEDFHPRVETTDLDMYLPNPKSAKAANLLALLHELSYIRSDDTLTGKTTFLSSNGFEIEFLTVPNRTMPPVLRVPGMSIGAEALPKMAPIGWSYVELEWEEMKIKVASPASSIIQKLLINEERKPKWKKRRTWTRSATSSLMSRHLTSIPRNSGIPSTPLRGSGKNHPRLGGKKRDRFGL